MKTNALTKLALMKVTLAVALASGSALPGCGPTGTHESTGEFIDNAVITTKVKGAILEDQSLKSFQINVKTYKDVVQLSGFVDSARAVQRAGAVAAAVPGVASVRNDLIVK